MQESDRAASAQPAARLAFLDGLRALAALAVVAVHAFQIYGYDLEHWIATATPVPLGNAVVDQALILSYKTVWQWGPFAVPVFIVLSGFSLMLPLVQAPGLQLKGGAGRFYWRRARRILPPYYAALAVAMLVTALVPGFGAPSGVYWDLALPTFQADVILAHLLLVHNLPWASDPLLGMRINPPLWSIAVEMQIYLLFPLLIALWRRAGAAVAVGLALAVGIATSIMGVPILPLSNTHYLGLFAMGMLGAYIAFRHPTAAAAHRWRWLALTGGSIALFLGAGILRGLPGFSGAWVRDTLLGIAMLGVLVHGAVSERGSAVARPRYVALLSAPPLVALGERSYSLYLIHIPILALIAALFIGLPASLAYPLVFVVGFPACIAAAALFFRIVERRFLNGLRPLPGPKVAGARVESVEAQPYGSKP